MPHTRRASTMRGVLLRPAYTRGTAENACPDVQCQAHRSADAGNGAVVGRERRLPRPLFDQIRRSRKGKPTGTVLASFPTDLMDRPQTTPGPSGRHLQRRCPVKKGKRSALVLTETGGSPAVLATDKNCGGARFEDDDLDNSFVKIPGDNVVLTVVTT